MKTLAFILSNLLLIASLAQAQTGTAQEKEFWTTVTETTEPPQEIVTNPQAFDRDATQMTSRLESKQGEAAVWLDPALWKYEKTPSSDTADPGSVIAGMDAIRFTHKEGEIEGMLVVQDSPLSLPQILA